MKLNINPSRNLDNLLSALNAFNDDIKAFKAKELDARLKNNEKVVAQAEKKTARTKYVHYDTTVNLGPFEHFFFYLVLDNVKSLFKIERQKKILEKLAINQVHLEPRCFSMIVINDSLVQEVQVFKEHTNVFDEYMFFNFFFSPMSETQLRRVIFDLLTQHY